MTSSYKTRWLLAALVFIPAIVLRIWIGESGLFYDDGMIVLRVASNIARGYGFCYNVGEHVQAATSLLWTLLSALVWKISPDHSFSLIRGMGVLMDSLAAVGLVLILLVAPENEKAAKDLSAGKIIPALIAGLFYATASTSALAAPSGLETGLYAFLISLSFLALIAARVSTAVVLSILLVLVRPDGVLVAGSIGAYVLITHPEKRRFATITYFVCGLLYLIGTYSYFHEILPQTVIAKELFQRSAVTQWSVIIHHFFLGAAAPTGILALAGAWEIAIHRASLRIFLIWSALYIFCFATFSEWWPWYLPPVVLAYCLCVGVGFESILRYAMRLTNSEHYQLPVGIAAALAISVASLFLTLRKVPAMAMAQTLRLQRGQRVASLITASSAPGDSVMLEPLGIIGFYTPRTFYDYPGLASPRTTRVLRTLGREVSKVPDSPEVMKMLLEKVKPDFLVLREHEYEVDEAGHALSSCNLVATVPVRVAPVEQPILAGQCGDCDTTMYLLKCLPTA